MLDIDTAIKHCLEVAERYETRAKIIDRRKLGFALENPTACHECAADHRQLAEWLKELKELRNSIGAVKLKDIKDAVGLLQELNTENDQLTSQLDEAKRLLKAAVEDIKDMLPHTDSCDDCALNKDDAHDCSNSTLNCDVKCKWRYADEALKLLEGDTNG